MIRTLYKRPFMVSFWQKVWVFSTFTLLNYLFYYCSLLVSFSTLVSPLPTLITCGFACWLITDTLFHWVATGRLWNLHCVIDMLLLLLWIVGMFVSEVRWLSLAILLRLKDILYVKELLFEMFKNNDLQFKAYVVAKILYWVLLVGHITGCLFYWIDQYTINNQIFGAFALNPQNYYQGQLLAYTPIEEFDELNRYLYAIYYSHSLLSLIAFGDIIGKNYYEQIYVMILIIVSTVGISLIVEQMYIVFKTERQIYAGLVNQARFLSQKLKNCQAVSRYLRYETINFLIATKMTQHKEEPIAIPLSKELMACLLRESIIGSRTPDFFSLYLLQDFTETHMPQGSVLLDYDKLTSVLCVYLIAKGSVKIGYTSSLLASQKLDAKGLSFGCAQMLAGTNYRNRALKIVVEKTISVYQLNSRKFTNLVKRFRQDRHDNNIQECYQRGKDSAIFITPRSCHYCSSNQHTLVDCPKCHLVTSICNLLKAEPQNIRNSLYSRKTIHSQKSIGLTIPVFQWRNNERQKLMQKVFALRKQLQELSRDGYLNTASRQFSSEYHKWVSYCPEFELSSGSC